MEFEWDKEKAEFVLRTRGIVFADVARLFNSTHIIISSDKMGEIRWRIIGEIGGICTTGIFTRRGPAIRIITARRSWKNEEREYRSLHPG